MKHGLLLTDEFFGFCADKVVTENARYSLIDYLNSEDNNRSCYILQFDPPKVMEYIKETGIISTEEYVDMFYWLNRGDITEVNYKMALQKAWMILKEMEECRKCGGKNE